jgi:hypothetical protein
MKKFIRALYQSFYSRDFYREAALQWKGTGIGLLSGLALLWALYIGLSILTIPGNEYEKFKADLINQTPQVTIENGALSIDKPVPYSINFEREEKIAVIDTSEAASNLSLDQVLEKMRSEKIAFFATKHQVVTLKNDNESRIYDLKDVKEKITFGKTEVTKWIGILEIIIIPLIAIFMFGGLLVYKILQMLTYSLGTMLIDKFIKSGLEYGAMQRITSCAIFPATILGGVFAIAGSDLPFLLSLIGTLVFITFGLKSAKITNA